MNEYNRYTYIFIAKFLRFLLLGKSVRSAAVKSKTVFYFISIITINIVRLLIANIFLDDVNT